METHVITLALTVFTTVFIVYAEGAILRPGRHVCAQKQDRLVPVQTTESYCRPKNQRIFVLCPDGSRRICVSHRLMYITEFKKVVRMIPQRQQVYHCCPGWTSYNWRHNGCTKPTCNDGCQNGGVCVLPNRCHCTVGWEGMQCQQDTNECSSADHGCTHVCQNVPGSYQCSCYDGFQLRPDHKSCEFCLSCTDDYRDLILENQYLREDIEIITTKNINLDNDIKALREDLMKVWLFLEKLHAQLPVTPPLAFHQVEELDTRVDSLEQQIRECDCLSPVQLSQYNTPDKPTPPPITVTEQPSQSKLNWDYDGYTGKSGKES